MEDEDFGGKSRRGLLKWDNSLPKFCLSENNSIPDKRGDPQLCSEKHSITLYQHSVNAPEAFW